jgi:hypothetical protein
MWLTLLHLVAAAIGTTLICMAYFLEEEEEQRLEHALERLWQRVVAAQQTALSRQAVFLAEVSTLTSRLLNRALGTRMLGITAVAVSLSFSASATWLTFAAHTLGRAMAHGHELWPYWALLSGTAWLAVGFAPAINRRLWWVTITAVTTMTLVAFLGWRLEAQVDFPRGLADSGVKDLFDGQPRGLGSAAGPGQKLSDADIKDLFNDPPPKSTTPPAKSEILVNGQPLSKHMEGTDCFSCHGAKSQYRPLSVLTPEPRFAWNFVMPFGPRMNFPYGWAYPTLSVVCDFLSLLIVRALIQWIPAAGSVLKAVGLLLVATLVPVCLYWIPGETDILIPHAPLSLNALMVYSMIAYVGQSNAFSAMGVFLFAVVALAALVHRTMWTVVKRPILAVHRHALIKERKLLLGVGVGLLAWGTPFGRALESALTLLHIKIG